MTVHLPQVGLFSDLQYEPADVRRLALRSELPSVHRVARDHSSVGAMTHAARGTSPGIHRHRRPPRFLREDTISGGKPVRIVVRWMRHCRSRLSNGWRTPTTGLRASLARQFNRTQNAQPFTARGACDGHRFARDHEPHGPMGGKPEAQQRLWLARTYRWKRRLYPRPAGSTAHRRGSGRRRRTELLRRPDGIRWVHPMPHEPSERRGRPTLLGQSPFRDRTGR